MVRVITNLPTATYDKIIELVRKGDYSDVSQFITAACENQLTLDQDDIEVVNGNPSAEKQEITVPLHSPQTPKERSSQRKTITSSKRKSKKTKPATTRKQIKDVSPEDVENAISFFRISSTLETPERIHPVMEYISEWPWGQANRYLPMKLVVRALANAGASGSWPAISTINESLKWPAGVIGSVLEIADRKAGRKREAQLATALPRIDSDKSQQRFVSSFLCSLSPTGIFYPGGAFFYGLTGQGDGGKIALTSDGLDFCVLANPVIDGAPESATSTLSSEECQWLKAWVQRLPGEGEAFETVKKALGDDELPPGDLVTRVAEMIREDPSSGSFRIKFNGVVSRMVELNIIHRKWRGTRACYGKTD